MIGKFDPILSKVRTMTKNIYVFERNVSEGSELYPSDMIPCLLPKCDVVVITATSIINHTIDEVISYCKSAKEVCIVGPSTLSGGFQEIQHYASCGKCSQKP